eukprot:793255-Rhodomonas_salina.1
MISSLSGVMMYLPYWDHLVSQPRDVFHCRSCPHAFAPGLEDVGPGACGRSGRESHRRLPGPRLRGASNDCREAWPGRRLWLSRSPRPPTSLPPTSLSTHFLPRMKVSGSEALSTSQCAPESRQSPSGVGHSALARSGMCSMSRSSSPR